MIPYLIYIHILIFLFDAAKLQIATEYAKFLGYFATICDK